MLPWLPGCRIVETLTGCLHGKHEASPISLARRDQQLPRCKQVTKLALVGVMLTDEDLSSSAFTFVSISCSSVDSTQPSAA